MAAEKLTKHRLAQILITLSLLITAFFWRTITYQEIETIECVAEPKCSIFVNGENIYVTKDEQNKGVFTIYPISPDWEVTFDGKTKVDGDKMTLTPNANNSDTGISLIINDSVKILIKSSM